MCATDSGQSSTTLALPGCSPRGSPAEAHWRLALVIVLQFAEDLSDRQAVGGGPRVPGLEVPLALPLDDPGFDSIVLREFQARLVAGHAEHELLDAVLAVAGAGGSPAGLATAGQPSGAPPARTPYPLVTGAKDRAFRGERRGVE